MQLTAPVSLKLNIKNLVDDLCTADISDSTAIPKSRILLKVWGFFKLKFCTCKKIFSFHLCYWADFSTQPISTADEMVL